MFFNAVSVSDDRPFPKHIPKNSQNYLATNRCMDEPALYRFATSIFVSPKQAACAVNVQTESMKAPLIKNTVFDEANDRTYVVMAPRVLTDGELYSAIRVALLMRRGKRLAKGETLEIAMAKV
jgi:hypothetical protein